MKNLRSLLIMTSLVPALFATAQIEDYTLPDGKVVKIDRSVFPDLKYGEGTNPMPAEIVARRKSGRAKAQAELPPFVYNGEDKYFPPIFNQSGGSCGSAAGVGYQFTHEINSYRDLDASLPENQYPSHFTWLMAYQTSNTEDMARGNGIPNVPTYGGRTFSRLFGPQTHDDPDYGWMQGYDKWYSAMWNRAAYAFSFPPTNTPEGRQQLKEWLYNHCGDADMHGGGVVGIGVAAGPTSAAIPNTVANRQAGVAGMKYVKAWGDTYNHALTVCGYDDRIQFDLDGDGIVGETEEDEVGAWIIANSWGDGWENKGFIFCPYKYSYAVGTDTWAWTPGAYVIRKAYRPLRTVKLKMDYDHRSELLLSIGVSENLSASKPEKQVPMEHFRYAGNTLGAKPAPEVPMLGRWVDGMHYEPMEFGYDLTDLTLSADRTKPLKYFFIVKTKSDAIGNGTIYDASVINYEIDEEGVEIPFEEKDVAIRNRGRETIISVIVPGEQLYPPINLCVQDGVLLWTAPQPSSLKFIGYRVYQGTTLVAELPQSQTYYTPDATRTDAFSVKAVYQTGRYRQESASSNLVTLDAPQPTTNHYVDLDKSGIRIPAAILEQLSRATIEFWMRNDQNVNYSHQVGPGWGKFLMHNNSNGTLSVGWESSTTNRLDVGDIFSVKKWNHIAIVINRNVLSLYVNGAKKGSITSNAYSGLTALGDLLFGHADTNQWWMGGLDEVRVWKTARTLAEIRENMRVPIAAPALQPDLLLYLPMDTIIVNGETRLREYVSGKHASFLTVGTAKVVEDDGPLSGTKPTPSLTILEEEQAHVAGIPFRLTAQTLLSAAEWTWNVSGAEPAVLHGMSPTFIFSEAGTYNVECTVTFVDGSTLSAEKEIVVTEGTAPVAAFDVPCDTLPAGDRFSFINRTEGAGCTYLWSMPGAEIEETKGTNATALYPRTGAFLVTLTATNSYGSSSVTKEVVVQESAPAARFDISQTAIMLGDTLQLIDRSRYSPDSWQWELNNGSRALTTSDQSPLVVPCAPGVYDVSLHVANERGDNTLTQPRYLIVSNDDALSCLNFTGTEQLQIPCPFEEQQRALTLEWWMQPQQRDGSVSLKSSAGSFSASVGADGTLSLVLGSTSAASEEGYVVSGEWHHYALTYSYGQVKFYRDAQLVSTSATRLSTRMPVLQSITMGEDGFKGQIDEVRLWGKVLSEDAIKAYSNRHIEDVAAAESADALLLYYDFNQSGGNVQDRTSGGHDAVRVGFGPDGDAWSTALGVFTLDVDALMHGDISATYLTNYKNPYLVGSGTVNPNNSSRFKRLQMRTAKSRWQDANAITNGSIITGAHVDNSHHGDIQFETEWSGFASPLLDYRLWQNVTLPAGKYRFSIVPGDVDDMQTSRIVACEGAEMVSDAECEEKALAWNRLTEGTISFTLTEETEVSLGIIVNLTGQSSFGIHAFKLEGVTFEPIETVIPDGIAELKGHELPGGLDDAVFDLSGRKLSVGKSAVGRLPRGVYIMGGKKQIVK